MISAVIPGLIKLLESEGRQIKPCFVHGNFGAGNSWEAKVTKLPCTEGLCVFYAHNEFEIGRWLIEYDTISYKTYKSVYLELDNLGEMKIEREKRICLYSIYHDLMFSASHGFEMNEYRDK